MSADLLPQERERQALEAAYLEREAADIRAGDVDLSYIRQRKVLVTVAEHNKELDRVFHNCIIREVLNRLDDARRLGGVIPYPEGNLGVDKVDLLGQQIVQDLAKLIKKTERFHREYNDRARSEIDDLYAISRTPAEELAKLIKAPRQIVGDSR
jgi:hypothetical protein